MGYWGRYWLIISPRDPEDPTMQLGTRSPKGIRIYLDKYHTLEDYIHIIEHEDIHDAIDRKLYPPRDKKRHKKFLEKSIREDKEEHIMIKIMMLGRDTTANEFLGNKECICPICDLLKSDHNGCQFSACKAQIMDNWFWLGLKYGERKEQEV